MGTWEIPADELGPGMVIKVEGPGPGAIISDSETGETVAELDEAPDGYEGETLTITWDEQGRFSFS